MELPAFTASEASLDFLIAGFEDGTWPKEQWTHAAHLAAGAHYILVSDDAPARLRTNIPRYNISQGGANTEDAGYHETLTCFWHDVIRDFIGTLPAGLPRIEVVRRVIAEFAPQRDLFRQYYDFECCEIARGTRSVDSAHQAAHAATVGVSNAGRRDKR